VAGVSFDEPAFAAGAHRRSDRRVEEGWIRGLFLAVKGGSIDDASEEPLDFR
jgi:hypothetical protein